MTAPPQPAAPLAEPRMSRHVVHGLIRHWLLRHAPIEWLMLTQAWWIFWGMGFLLGSLFVWGPLGGYLDPAGGMAGVWLFLIMTTAAWLMLGGLFICRALCMWQAVPDALLQALLAAAPDEVPEADRTRLRQLIQQQGPIAYRALFAWCGKRFTLV